MKKYRIAVTAFIITGTLNLCAFIYVAGHREFVPAGYSQDYLSGGNVTAQVPAWIGHTP